MGNKKRKKNNKILKKSKEYKTVERSMGVEESSNESREDRDDQTQLSRSMIRDDLKTAEKSSSDGKIPVSSSLSHTVPLEHKIFLNDVIVSTIFKFMNLEELKRMEQVCKLWEEIPKPEITYFNFNTRPNSELINLEPIKFYELSSKTGEMKILYYSKIEQIEQKIQKPYFKKITINSWSNNSWNEEILNFFSKHGPDVSEFCFQGEEPENSSTFLFYFRLMLQMRTQFPNLQHLKYKPVVSPHLIPVDNLPEIQGLDSLKSVSIWKYYNAMGFRSNRLPPDLKIFLSSPNIQAIHNYPLQNIGELEDIQKVPMIKSFLYDTFNFNNEFLDSAETNLLHISVLANIGVQLENLSIVDAFSLIMNPERNLECLVTFNSLLVSSEFSLKKLKIQPLPFVPNLNFPCLLKLEYLQVSKTNQHSNSFFPTNFSPNTFPNLKILDLNIEIASDEELMEIFPPQVFNSQSSFPSLSKIVIRKSIGDSQIQQISTLFPNVKIVEVLINEGTLTTLPFVFSHFTHLKQLELSMKVDDDVKCLDSVLLGVEEENVHCLRIRQVSIWKFKKLQIYPSISLLSELSSLVFNLFDAGGGPKSPQILSRAFKEYYLKYTELNVELNVHKILRDRFRAIEDRIQMNN